jgi:hypothetical protein
MSSNHKQNRFNSCERGKCAMQWTQHMEGSRRLIHAQPRLHLPPELSRRTHRSQDFRVPQQHVRRALEVLLMALRRTWLLFPNTHKERTPHAPRKMMPTLVTNKLLYNEAGARCIWPSLSRGLTLTAEASTNHKQNRFNSCERGKCDAMDAAYGGESKAHPRTAEATLAAGAFTSHAPYNNTCDEL